MSQVTAFAAVWIEMFRLPNHSARALVTAFAAVWIEIATTGSI